MTPDQINEKHGKASWKCNTCGETKGLMWWNGLSVAVCSMNPRCSEAESKKFSDAIAEEEWFNEYARQQGYEV